ncbi:hypothetical protein ACFX2A_048341 [Malus domestica]
MMDVVISTVSFLQTADQTKIIAAIKEAGNIKRFFFPVEIWKPKPQPPDLIFTPPLPSNFGWKSTRVRFKQAASVHISSENSNMDKQQEEPTLKTGCPRKASGLQNKRCLTNQHGWTMKEQGGQQKQGINIPPE